MSAHDNTSGAGEAPLAASLRRFRARYGLLLEWVVGALMVILAAEVTIGVVFRTIGHSLSWYDELASVLLAWLTYYGSALASVKRAHIGCPEIVEQMPWGRTPRLRHRRAGPGDHLLRAAWLGRR